MRRLLLLLTLLTACGWTATEESAGGDVGAPADASAINGAQPEPW